jgi:hypothetical protein
VHFTILLDESTDISNTKFLCLLARYISPRSGQVLTKLLELIPLDARDTTGEAIFNKFTATLNKFEIPLEHILGVASDGANVMVGSKNSFFSRLKQEVPHSILLKCICHSAALIASYACSELPKEAESLLRQIYTYISGSAKRCAQLIEMQTYFNLKHYKILKLCDTRWLSLHDCISRILQNWDVLVSYFQIACLEDQLETANTILNLMQHKTIKSYLLFLKYALNFINSFNSLFQSSDILIHSLAKKSQILFQQFAQNFIHNQLLPTDRKPIDLLNPHCYLPLEEIYLGTESNAFVNTLSLPEQHGVRVKILQFYVTAARHIIKRLPLDGIFRDFEFILPCHVFNKNRVVFKDISRVTNAFQTLLDTNKSKMSGE